MKCLRTSLAVAVLVVAASLTVARAGAPKTADGGKIHISVLTDRNLTPDLAAKQVEQYNQVGEFMEKDLVATLAKAGYEAAPIQKKEEFTPGQGKYLLAWKIVRYSSGSKAARMVVGFGAGATSLDIHFTLSADGTQELLAKDDGVGSSRDWTFCCRKLDQNIEKAVSAALVPPAKP